MIKNAELFSQKILVLQYSLVHTYTVIVVSLCMMSKEMLSPHSLYDTAGFNWLNGHQLNKRRVVVFL